MQEHSLYDIIDNIVNVVFYKYFSYVTNPSLKQDLFQEGYLKAYELINNGNYDPDLSLRNFIFTGVRNAMTNYMYHYRKESHVDLEILDKYDNTIGTHDVRDFDIDINYVKSITNNFSCYGNLFIPVVKYLNKLGIVNYKIQDNECEEKINQVILDGVITLVIWELYYKEMDS